MNQNLFCRISNTLIQFSWKTNSTVGFSNHFPASLFYENISILDNQNQSDDAVSESQENLLEYTSKMANIKKELMDPSALHELAEISMRHANSSTKSIFKCEMCDEVFTDRGQLLVHVPIHIWSKCTY